MLGPGLAFNLFAGGHSGGHGQKLTFPDDGEDDRTGGRAIVQNVAGLILAEDRLAIDAQHDVMFAQAGLSGRGVVIDEYDFGAAAFTRMEVCLVVTDVAEVDT